MSILLFYKDLSEGALQQEKRRIGDAKLLVVLIDMEGFKATYCRQTAKEKNPF